MRLRKLARTAQGIVPRAAPATRHPPVSLPTGSVSAEHGLGRMKSEEIRYSKDASSVAVMHTLKACLDPRGILNPYKVLPPPSAGDS